VLTAVFASGDVEDSRAMLLIRMELAVVCRRVCAAAVHEREAAIVPTARVADAR
jgi:hypothetical protein